MPVMKMTKPQVAAMERLSSGDRLCCLTSGNSRFFWESNPTGEAPSNATIAGIQAMRWIVEGAPAVIGARWAVTAAGRAALATWQRQEAKREEKRARRRI